MEWSVAASVAPAVVGVTRGKSGVWWDNTK